MKIYHIADQNQITAYHGTREPFDAFDSSMTAQGVFWFAEDRNQIINQEAGANSSDFIATVKLSVNNPAGWKEYDKYFLQQIEDMGFDSIKLDSYWIVFDKDNIEILNWEKTKKD